MIEQCCIKGCENRGEPEEGFEFFMCESCMEELMRLLNMEKHFS